MRVVVVFVGLLVVLSTSCFELERTRGLGEGSITLRVVDDAGEPVVGAVVSVDGTARVSTSDSLGLVAVDALLPGDQLLRVFVDDDDDGLADRAAVVTTGGVQRAEFSTGSFTAAVTKLSSDVLGDVAVAAVGSIEGAVTGCDVELCRVVVFREVSLGRLAPRDVAGVVEASAGVFDVDGSFSIPGVAAGAVKVVAFSWPRPLSTDPVQQMIAASKDITRFAVVDAVVVAGDVTADVDLVLADVPASVATELEISGEPEELERAAGQAFFSAPETVFDAPQIGTISGAISAIDAPIGVFNVEVNLDNGLGGLMRRAIAVPGIARLGPIQTGAFAGCRQFDGKDDCDGDGVNVEDDDDDDGDGQVDALEPACRGPGLGTDRDGDCLCEPADPFPDCASNDPVACELVEAPVCDPS